MTDALTAQALLFDMDGTLVDSTVVVERTWNTFAERHGLDPQRILATSHGRRTEETVARFAPAGIDVEEETKRIVAAEVSDVDGVVATPGASALLAAIPARRWALVTSASRELAERRMGAAGLPLPDVMITADDVVHGKPAPEGYLAAAAALGTAAADTVAFEDAEAGLLAARASGAVTILVGDHVGPAGEGLIHLPDLRQLDVQDHDGPALHIAFHTESARL